MLTKFLQPVAVLLITLVFSFAGHAQNLDSIANQQSTSETPRPVPQSVLDMELESATGDRFRLSSYQGNIVVLGFWATWCGPCRFQTPVLVKLQKKFRAQGVRMIELSTEDPNSSVADVRHWMRTYKVNYRVGWAPKELASTLTQSQQSLPQIFVIGRDGRILKRFIGFNEQTEPILKRVIAEALKEQLK